MDTDTQTNFLLEEFEEYSLYDQCPVWGSCALLSEAVNAYGYNPSRNLTPPKPPDPKLSA